VYIALMCAIHKEDERNCAHNTLNILVLTGKVIEFVLTYHHTNT